MNFNGIYPVFSRLANCSIFFFKYEIIDTKQSVRLWLAYKMTAQLFLPISPEA